MFYNEVLTLNVKGDIINKHMIKNIILGVLSIVIGIYLIYLGVNTKTITLTNLGFAGIFIGIVILAFIPSNLISYEAYECSILPYLYFVEKFITNLNLEGKAVYIPPYKNLPKGGMFISANKDFHLNLENFDEDSVFLTRENGILISPPLGYSLVKEFEEYAEMELKDADLGLAISVSSSVLKAFGLIDGIDVLEKDNNEIELTIENVKLKFCKNIDKNICEKVACPICSSILFAIAKSLNQLILVERYEKHEKYIKIVIKKLGKLEDYL